MNKIMWIVAMIPVVVTSVVLQFMPDIIPMHHDLEGNTDRWGSKTESFIFPVIILFITLFRSVYKELHADHETGAADNK